MTLQDTGKEEAVRLIRIAASVAGAAETPKGGDVCTLSNGIVLKLKHIPPYVMSDVVKQLPVPEVPETLNPTTERMEPNPIDPNYLASIEKYNQDLLFAITNVLIVMGTSIVSVPDGLPRPEDDEWLDVLDFLGLTGTDANGVSKVDLTNKHARYFAWLRYFALEREDDVGRIVASTIVRSGVAEAEVQRMVTFFRSAARRGADTGEGTSKSNVDRDSV